MFGKVGDGVGQDQSPAVRCTGIVFLGMATMHDQDGSIEPPQKVLTVRFDLELIDHPPTAIGDHPVNGNDRVAAPSSCAAHFELEGWRAYAWGSCDPIDSA